MNQEKPLRFGILALLIALGLVVLNVYKAATMSITHDEALTLEYYSDDGFLDVLSYNAQPQVPNNHILNTLSVKAITSLLGTSALALRLPSLLSLVLFLVFGFLIIVRYVAGNWRVAAWMLLTLNPFLMDFFVLARGYAMGAALLVAAIGFMLRMMEAERVLQNGSWAMVFSSLAVLANMTYFTPFLLIVVAVMAYSTHWGRISFSGFRGWLPLISTRILVLAGSVALLYEPLRYMLQLNQAVGPKNGFWQDTMGVLYQDWAHIPPWGPVIDEILYATVVAIVVAAAGYAFRQAYRLRSAIFTDQAAIVSLLTIGAGCLNWLQFHWMGTPFLNHRTAIMYYPMFALSCGLLLPRWFHRASKFLQLSLASTLSLFLSVHMVSVQRFSYFLEWRNDGCTKDLLHYIETDWKSKGIHRPATLGITWLFEPVIGYYQREEKLDWLAPVHQNGFMDKPYDYYMIYYPEDEWARHHKVILIDSRECMWILAQDSVPPTE